MIITFQPLQEFHFPLLLKWLEMLHVKAWWDPDVVWTLELISEKYRSYVQGYKIEQGLKKHLRAYIIYVENDPVGYIQIYNAHDFPREDKNSLAELSNSLATLDIFIGEEDFLGKGLGSHILKQFLSQYVDPHHEACFVDPDTANIKAIRTYEKAGFKKIKTIKEGTVTWMMREYNNSQFD
jgi:aminoglycoside 6'-N-acetyltransferase